MYLYVAMLVCAVCNSQEFVVQVNDHLQFLPSSPSHPLRVLLSTAQSGHTHLALVQTSTEGGVSVSHVTSGAWSVLGSTVCSLSSCTVL